MPGAQDAPASAVGTITAAMPTDISSPASRISIMAENFAGMRSQAFGLARYIGLEAQFHIVHPPGFLRRRLPAFLGNPAALVEDAADIGPGAVVSVGGKGAWAGAAFRRADRPVVQIQNPRMRLSRFDLVIANTHDEIKGDNVLLSRTALHGVTPSGLAAWRAAWAPRFSALRRPLVAVLVGGSNGRFRFEAEGARDLMRKLAEAVRHRGAALFVTPSRRTAPEASAILREGVTALGGEFWDGQGENPYPGLLACADFIITTMDSVSMISEAAATAVPVLVYPLPGRSRRSRLFIEELVASGRIRIFEGTLADWPVVPLNDTPIVAAEACRRLGLPYAAE